MILHGLALAAHIARCAPNVGLRTMAAIVQVESSGDPLAIADNTTMRSYHMREQAEAEELARRLIAAGHSVDLGLAQIDDANLTRLGLSLRTVFDTCANLTAGAQILADDYSTAIPYFGQGQVALRHAIGMYNTGRLDAGAAYVRRVLIAAGVRKAMLDLRPRRSPEPNVASSATRHAWTQVTISIRIARPRRLAAAQAPIMVEEPPASQMVLP
jgi:type IV secretion system protein VirB1